MMLCLLTGINYIINIVGEAERRETLNCQFISYHLTLPGSSYVSIRGN